MIRARVTRGDWAIASYISFRRAFARIGAKITQAEENCAKQTQELVAAGCLEEGLPDGGRIVNKFSCTGLRNKTDL